MKYYDYPNILKFPYNLISGMTVVYIFLGFFIAPILSCYLSKNRHEFYEGAIILYMFWILSSLFLLFVLYFMNYPDITIIDNKIQISFLFMPIKIDIKEVKKVVKKKSINYFTHGLYLKKYICSVRCEEALKSFKFTDRISSFEELISFFENNAYETKIDGDKTIFYFRKE
jgi:hypothetical protein